MVILRNELTPIEYWTLKGIDFSERTRYYSCTHVYVADNDGFPPCIINDMIAKGLNGIIEIAQTNDGQIVWGFYEG